VTLTILIVLADLIGASDVALQRRRDLVHVRIPLARAQLAKSWDKNVDFH
jgi:hypothetical protein